MKTDKTTVFHENQAELAHWPDDMKPVIGPKNRKSDVQIPTWASAISNRPSAGWTQQDDARLGKTINGTTPVGRELIQKALWRWSGAAGFDWVAVKERYYPLLNPAERSLLDGIVNGNRTKQRFLRENLWRCDYKQRPPSMEEFLSKDYYLGKTLNPAQSGGIWPGWYQVLRESFDRDSLLNNVVLTGALGTGKTTIMVVILLYRLTLAMLLKRPADFFRVGSGSPLYFAILSVSLKTVNQTVLNLINSLLSASAFFRQCLGSGSLSRGADGAFEMQAAEHNETQNSIKLMVGSKRHHLLGLNVLGIGFDEGNFRLEMDREASAFKLFSEIRDRLVSRLQQQQGYLSGISIVASSASDESSFTEKLRKEIEASAKPHEQKIIQRAIYEVKPLSPESLQTCFKVEFGIPNVDPQLIDGKWNRDGKPIELSPGQSPASPNPLAKYVLVPYMYLEPFKRNCRDALQNICGISFGGSGRLFATMADVDWCLKVSAEEGVPRTWHMDEIPISADDDKKVWDYLDHPSFLTKRNGIIKPKRHSESLRYAHLDLATNSYAGIAICHLVAHDSDQNPTDNEDPFEAGRLVVEYDLLLAITPGKNHPINFEKIQQLFLWLKQLCGFRFGVISADQYQSVMPLQMLESKGIPTGPRSIDRDKTAYRQWRGAFEEHRIRMAPNKRMYDEASRLIEKERKFDHPDGGTKDLTDAAAGAYMNAVDAAAKSSGVTCNHPCLDFGAIPVTHATTQLPDLDMVPKYTKRVTKEYHA